jgi:hypothetical protein
MKRQRFTTLNVKTHALAKGSGETQELLVCEGEEKCCSLREQAGRVNEDALRDSTRSFDVALAAGSGYFYRLDLQTQSDCRQHMPRRPQAATNEQEPEHRGLTRP